MHFLSTNVIKKIKLRGFRMPHTLIRISTAFNIVLLFWVRNYLTYTCGMNPAVFFKVFTLN